MHDALLVCEDEATSDRLRDLQALRERERSPGVLEQALDVAAAHQLRHDARRYPPAPIGPLQGSQSR